MLLLNLQKQAQLEELLWIPLIERFRRNDLSSRELAVQTLEEVTLLTIRSFPHAILPNKLLQELRALVKGTELYIPLVDEIAADIFMGQFTAKAEFGSLVFGVEFNGSVARRVGRNGQEMFHMGVYASADEDRQKACSLDHVEEHCVRVATNDLLSLTAVEGGSG